MALIEFNRNLKENIDALREDISQRADNEIFLQERIAELELALEDQGWERLEFGNGRELTKQSLNEIAMLARKYWLKNPLIRRAIVTKSHYIFGQGVSFEAEANDVNFILQNFVEDQTNKDVLFSQASFISKEMELELFGNLFFALFVDDLTGKVRIRTIPFEEITEVIKDPEDKSKPLYYKRTFTKANSTKTKIYPDWNNNEPDPYYKNIPVEDNVYIFHLSVNKLSDMTFGVSEVYSAIDWAKAYKNFLEDWATIVNAQSSFAWKLKTKGGQQGVKKAKASLGSSFATNQSTENNPSPSTGSTWIEGAGATLESMKTGGPPTKAEDGDKMIHMVSAGTGIFYHYLTGDPSTGNLATAKSMERPMELEFKTRQSLWEDSLKRLFKFIIEQSVKSSGGYLKGTIEEDFFGEKILRLGPDTDNPDPKKRGEEMSHNIHINFPDLLEKDTEKRVNAIINAATLNGRQQANIIPEKELTRLLLAELDVDNIEEMVNELYPEESGLSKQDWISVFKQQMQQLKEAYENHSN